MAPESKGFQVNYYDVLGVLPESTEKEILKAYRKKALACHPDKNPDNPRANELFHGLSEALKVLTDPKAKAAYDAVLKAKEAARLRTQALDAKRKKFKEDLESRETAVRQEKESDEITESKLHDEIKRLREEGSRLLKEQQELIRSQIEKERKRQAEDKITPKLKVKWKVDKRDRDNGGYNYENLMTLFERYGPVLTLVLSLKKNGLAIVEYGNSAHAALAMEFEKGLPENWLEVTWLERPTNNKSESHIEKTSYSEEANKCTNVGISDIDFESMVLMKMRQAEERKTADRTAGDQHIT